MADFPRSPFFSGLAPNAIAPSSLLSAGPAALPVAAAAAWPSANLAFFVPFRLPFIRTVKQMACGTGSGSQGNFDLGVYDWAGNRLVSTGSTAKTTATSERVIDVTDTTLYPSSYYLAMATDGTTDYLMHSMGSGRWVSLVGAWVMASAFPLPATATFASAGPSEAYIPAMCAIFKDA